MVSKVLSSAFVVLLVAQVTLANPAYCPDPSVANQLVYTQDIQEPAAEIGRLEKDYIVPPQENEVTCIVLSGGQTGSIASVGITEDGIKIRLVSEITLGIEAQLQVYTN